MANPKYDSAEHHAQREHWRPIVAAGHAYCAEPICLEERDGRTRWITPGTPWHVSHDPTGTAYLGPSHQRCNTSEAAWRRQHGNQPRPPRRWDL